MKVRYIWSERIAALMPNKAYDVVSIERGYHEGWYRIVTETGEESIFHPNLFEIIDSSNSPKEYDPLKLESNRVLMTLCYKEFLAVVHSFIDNPLKENAILFTQFVDDFWFNHEQDLYFGSPQNFYDEHSLVGDIMKICDRFDECDEIVKHDRYCIGTNQLYQKIIERINYLESPVYE